MSCIDFRYSIYDTKFILGKIYKENYAVQNVSWNGAKSKDQNMIGIFMYFYYQCFWQKSTQCI